MYEGLSCHRPEDPNYCVLRFDTMRYSLMLNEQDETAAPGDAVTKGYIMLRSMFQVYVVGSDKAIEFYQRALTKLLCAYRTMTVH